VQTTIFTQCQNHLTCRTRQWHTEATNTDKAGNDTQMRNILVKLGNGTPRRDIQAQLGNGTPRQLIKLSNSTPRRDILA